MKIKNIKLGNKIYNNINISSLDENGEIVWNVPSSLEEFKICAVNTINWKIGKNIKKASGGKTTDLSAVNSKAIALIIKKLNSLDTSTDIFTTLEKQSWDLLLSISKEGYSDSQKLLDTLEVLEDNVSKMSNVIDSILKAKTHEEVIMLLNKDI